MPAVEQNSDTGEYPDACFICVFPELQFRRNGAEPTRTAKVSAGTLFSRGSPGKRNKLMKG